MSGLMDILAAGEEGNFVIFELKLCKGPGCSYWPDCLIHGGGKKHIAKGKKVSGAIAVKKVDCSFRHLE
ncbi:hypothetical protein PspKH34_17790 [Parageobacillus sp. KH3-4]|nr:hypothetical protein PspKH34_17790 [Parageobacillus sp. KH3-4]